MKILGIHLGHDSSACIIYDGKVLFAEEEERITGEKNYFGYPYKVISYIESHYLKNNETFEIVAIGWNIDELLKGRNKLKTLKTKVDENWISKKIDNALSIKQYFTFIKEQYPRSLIVDYEHHLCHSASVIPFNKKCSNFCSIVLDAYGEKNSGIILRSSYNINTIIANIPLNKSIGYFYQRWAEVYGYRGKQACGYLMSLAGYGDFKKYRLLFEDTFLKKNANLNYFELKNFHPYAGNNENSIKCFPKNFIDKYVVNELNNFKLKADYAASIQYLVEKIVLSLLKYLKEITALDSIALSGGVFMNCMLLSKIYESKIFSEVFTTPSAKDSGVAIGAAILAYRDFSNGQLYFNTTPYLGRNINFNHLKSKIPKTAIVHQGKEAIEKSVNLLLQNKSIAVVDGRLEFGPRALGARSILMSPYNFNNKAILNKIKSREWFQPIAISISPKTAKDLFNLIGQEPFMNRNASIKEENKFLIPAAVHADNSSRVHILDERSPEILKEIISKLGQKDLPEVLLNTSFNPKGKPLPGTIDQALNYYYELDVDYFLCYDILIYLSKEEKHILQI